MNRRKATLILVALSLLVLPMAANVGHAAPGVANCLTTATVTPKTNGSYRPRPFVLGGTGGTDTTSASVIYFCAGAVTGVQVGGSADSNNIDHCLNDFPGVPSVHGGGGARDEVAWLPFCATPIGVTHVTGIGPGGMTLTPTGTTCSWATNGHSWFTVARLDLDNFTCSNGFGGGDTDATSESVAALLFAAASVNGTSINGCSPVGAPANTSICWTQAVSQGVITAVDPS